MFWKLVISALVLPVSIGFSSTAVQASTNSKVSFLDETSSHTSQNLETVQESPQLIATYYKKCSYRNRNHHNGHGHHNNRHGGHGGHGGGGYRNNSYGGHGGGYRNNSYGGYRNNSYGGHGGGHHNNNNHNQGYYNH